MDEYGTSGEGNPAIERAEQQALGTTTYQKAEVVHRYADTHPWVHPTLLAGGIILVAAILWFIFRKRKVIKPSDPSLG